MTERKQRTNGAGGLTWSTILTTVTIVGFILGVGFAHWSQGEVMSEKLDAHIAADKERDDRVEARVHTVELTVAAMRGGE